MHIAIPQLNYFANNINKNYEIMSAAIKKAKKEKADLIVFPELAVCGSYPEDWLEKEYFIEECRLIVENLALQCDNMAAIIGAPNLDAQNGIMYNSAYFIQNGEVINGVHKTVLSDYDVYSECRYFVAGEENNSIRYKNTNIRILFDEYEGEYIDKKDDIILFIGTTPFTSDSLKYRQSFLSALGRKYAKNIIEVSRSGANTSLVFDGNSMVYNHKGQLVHQLNSFQDDFCLIDLNKIGKLNPIILKEEKSITLIHQALVTGITDYFYKNNFKRAILGLSGGIDSALVAALAVEALGKENVTGILMPSEFSSDHSVEDAEHLAKNLGIQYEILPIKAIYDQYMKLLSGPFQGLPFNVAEENIQARIRGAILLSFSNKFGHIVLNTSNKSEDAVGYSTLYGDLCGSLSVIGDLYKVDVYLLAKHINRTGILIPENTITKAPSAELRPDQQDTDSLPEYDILDKILYMYIEENKSIDAIIASGIEENTVVRITSLVDKNEYKRAQSPPNIKVSKKAFGSGRRMPF